MVIYIMKALELIYFAGFSAKRRYSTWNRKELPYPVVSIGNITTGGTGKTPAVIAVAREALKRGFGPVILTRGYRGTAGGPCFVSRGNEPLLSADEAGDEPVLMAEQLRDVPIVKCGDRYRGGLFAVKELGLRGRDSLNRPLFILDDGFQHWRLGRCRDIVLVDSRDPFGNGKLLPAGRLREPPESLGRADVIVLTKSPDDPDALAEISQAVRRLNRRSPIFRAQHKPAACQHPSGDRKPIAWIAGKSVFGFCGLANPASFRETLESSGAVVQGEIRFRDHHRFTLEDIARVCRDAERHGAEWIVTTGKDAVKLRRFDLPRNFLIIEIEFAVSREFYEEIFQLS